MLVSDGLGYSILKELFNDDSLQIAAVFTNRKSDEIVSFCRDNKLLLFIGNPRNGKAKDFIQNIECEVLLSVNYLYIIEKDLINLQSGYAVNIHGSLLPKYRGRTPHVWAIINGEKEAGITAHIIDEDVDNGGTIHQIKVLIQDNDTGAMILQKYNKEYLLLINTVLQNIKNKTLTITTQDSIKATYFGKRTPADGQIVWDWSKERIRNWIRAQAKPYSGAFFYVENAKITVHKASFHELGFNYQDANGKVLAVNENIIIVKTPNGAIVLENFTSEDINLKIKKGIVLS